VVHQVTYSKLANLELLKHDRDVTHAQTRIVGDIDEGKVEISRGQSVKMVIVAYTAVTLKEHPNCSDNASFR